MRSVCLNCVSRFVACDCLVWFKVSSDLSYECLPHLQE